MQVLLTIAIMWGVCGVLTATGALPPGHAARTDAKLELLRGAPWFRVPYPGTRAASREPRAASRTSTFSKLTDWRSSLCLRLMGTFGVNICISNFYVDSSYTSYTYQPSRRCFLKLSTYRYSKVTVYRMSLKSGQG